MGYPPSHPLHAQAAEILMDHQAAAAQGGERLGISQGNRRPAVGFRARVRIAARPWESDSKGGMAMTSRITRRQGLLGLFGGSLGLKAFVTGPARLVPAEPAARHRAGSAVRDHRARRTCST